MWAKLGRALVKVAIWAAGHPEVLDIVLKAGEEAAKSGKKGA